jgi:hypothetical protein
MILTMTAETKSTLPTIAELTGDIELAYKNDAFNLLLNQPPPEKWVKEHPFIKGYKYLPIDKVELMLRKIFKQYRIEIIGQGTAFNGVWVTVRVHYLNPITGEWLWNDGIGAAQLQTAKGTSASDLININNGAISMAFPIAKTVAVKDACDHFGSLFGANLNRKDVVEFTPDTGVAEKMKQKNMHDIPLELEAAISEADKDSLGEIFMQNRNLHSNPQFMILLNSRKKQINDASK